MNDIDIVDWLRKEAELIALPRLAEAAAEIERLRRRVSLAECSIDAFEQLQERLRAFPPGDGEGGLFHDAADEIERLKIQTHHLECVIETQDAEIERLWAARRLLGDALDTTKIEHERLQDEIEQLHIDKAAISDTASGYLHEIERLRVENERLQDIADDCHQDSYYVS